MKTQNALFNLALCVILGMASTTHAAEDVKVYLAAGPEVSDDVARMVLAQMNGTLAASGLAATHKVSSARTIRVGDRDIPMVDDSDCTETNAADHAECVADKFKHRRHTHNADIVVVVVKTLNSCGSTRKGTVNRKTIGFENQHLAYAVVKADCLTNPSLGIRIASHEIGHLLSLEHSSDSLFGGSRPVPDNHAAESDNDLTVMGNAGVGGDCLLGLCTIRDFFSQDGRTFADGSAAGDSSRANSRKVLVEKSWNEVAAYRPLATLQAPQCEVIFFGCNEQRREQVFVSFEDPFGFPVNNFVAQKKLSNGTWSTLGSLSHDGCIPYSLAGFGQQLFRVLMQTAIGTSECQVNYIPDMSNCQEFP